MKSFEVRIDDYKVRYLAFAGAREVATRLRREYGGNWREKEIDIFTSQCELLAYKESGRNNFAWRKK